MAFIKPVKLNVFICGHPITSLHVLAPPEDEENNTKKTLDAKLYTE